MPVQQLMIAQKISAGSGGGLPPDTYAGLTFWYDGDNSAHYNGSADNSGSPSNSGSFERFDSAASIARVVTVAPANPMTRLIPVVGSSSGLRTASSGGGNVYVKPSSGVGPSTAVTLGTLFTSSNAVITFAIKVRSAPAAAGNPYDNPLIIGDASIYMGLHVYASGGNAVFVGLNYDGNYDQVTKTGPALGSWVVVTMRHTGGQLRIRTDGGAWTSIASGNTADTTQPMTLFYYAVSTLDADIAQFCTYNANRSDAEILEVERYFGAKVGLSF